MVLCLETDHASNRHFVLIEGQSQVFDIQPHDLVVLDDLMTEAAKSDQVTALFTHAVHHLPCFLIFLTQNLFLQNKEATTRHLNAHYLVLFKNPRDASAIAHLARQMYPDEPKFLPVTYADATKEPRVYTNFVNSQISSDHIFLEELNFLDTKTS